MRTRWIFIPISLVALAALSFWYSPYHQVRSIFSVVEIDAPGDRVWQVLTDLHSYRLWNPFITSASGTIAPGNKLAISIKSEKRTITFHPRVVTVQSGKKLVWLGHTLVPGLFDGEHEFELEEIDQSHTRVIQSERFRGVAVGFLWDRMSPDIARGFRAMNEALKRRCEQTIAAQ